MAIDTLEKPIPLPRVIVTHRSRGDRFFRGGARVAALTTLVLMVLVGGFLLYSGWTAISDAGWSFFTATAWNPDGADPDYGIAALLYWTATIAVISLLLAVPISLAAALFINEYAPRQFRSALRGLVDLLAAIPSLIYGIWGVAFLQPYLIDVSAYISARLSWIPVIGDVFEVDGDRFGSSPFIAGVVVSLMVIPITTSVIREVFSQTPPGEKEGALALGATRWGMIRAVVIPFGRGGIIGGSMLGLGRALGETIAVALIISPIFIIRPNILETGANSISANIALRWSEASEFGLNALLASGFVLFLVTLVVNAFASVIVSRSRSGKGVDA